jgi:amino acid adenylation domain-containing protein
MCAAGHAPSDDLTARVAHWARETPDALALVADDRRLTYAELDRAGDALAAALLERGAGPETVVALLLPASASLVVAELATLKARAAFLPLDPTWPAERLRLLLRDAGARLLITDRALTSHGALARDVPGLQRLDVGDTAERSPPVAAAAWSPEQLAYVVYTSGTTGAPKGVEVAQSSLAQLAAWHVAKFAVTAGDRTALSSPPAFDASIWEIWPSLAAGATLHVASEMVRASPFSLREWMAEHAITIAFLPTPWVEILLTRPWPAGAAPSLRTLLTGGDRLRRFAAPLPLTLVNNYGPTEATVVATSGALTPGPDAPHIGRPIDHARVYLLDGDRKPVAPGAVGELYIGGAGVARGYRGRPDETRERFLPDCFAGSGRMYKSGDLARLRPDGNLDFIGRVDDQIKRRGFRIEPGEIEAALLRDGDLREAAVVLHDAGGGARLVAFVAGDATVDEEALRARLAARLPAYMIPDDVVRLPALPRTPHGKLDRRALAQRPLA